MKRPRILAGLGRVFPLILVLGLAAPPRFIGLDFGSDLVHARPDELGVVQTLHGLRQGTVHPMLLAYGGGYHMPLYAFVRTMEWVRGRDSLGQEPLDFHRVKVVARLWSAILSTASVWLTFVAGRRFGGTNVGLVAALLLSVLSLPVREAHFAKADSTALCVTALVLVTLFPGARRGPRSAAALGAALAWAVSTKYLAGVVPAGIIALVMMGRPPGPRIDIGSLRPAALGALPVLLLLNLHWLLAPGLSWLFLTVVLRSQADYPHLPFLAGTVAAPLAYHTVLSLRSGCGLVVALLALPALLWGTASNAGRLLVVVVLGHAVALSLNHLVVARNILPVLPPLCVLIAGMLSAGTNRLGARGRRCALVAVTGLAIIEPVVNDARLLRALAATDTRSEAAAWMAAHLPVDARVARWGAPPGATPFGAPETGGRVMVDAVAPAQWHARGITHVVWDDYPLPFSNRGPPPNAGAGLRRLAVFDPFSGPARAAVLEPHDAFYLPLAGLAQVRRPGPRVEIFALDGTQPVAR
jgi:hypothetical protein